jgi:uncharacterized protein involved in oxidation of intracellular sulfur
MRTLLIINDPPYGTERAYNGFRLANSLAKRDDEEVRIFLMGDAASCAKSGQTLPQGYYSLERMLKIFRAKGGEIGVCGTCMEARGLTDDDLVEGALRSTLDELTDWTLWADKVLTF